MERAKRETQRRQKVRMWRQESKMVAFSVVFFHRPIYTLEANTLTRRNAIMTFKCSVPGCPFYTGRTVVNKNAAVPTTIKVFGTSMKAFGTFVK